MGTTVTECKNPECERPNAYDNRTAITESNLYCSDECQNATTGDQ